MKNSDKSVMTARAWFLLAISLLVPFELPADELKSGGSSFTSPTDPEIDPTAKTLNSLLYGDIDAAMSKMQAKYACTPLSSNPETRANELIAELQEPRTGDTRMYQGMCWNAADQTIKDLSLKDPALANTLRLTLRTNKESIAIQMKVESCSDLNSETSSRLREQLAMAAPFKDIFRTVPVQVPPAVSQKESLRQIRDSIYTESLNESVERSIALAKTHNLNYSDIVNRVCPAGSPCAQGGHLRDIKAFLQSTYDRDTQINIPPKSDADVLNTLQNAVTRMDSAAHAFNNQLSCRDVGSFLTGSNNICDSKSSYMKQVDCPADACSNPEKDAADKAADQKADQLNRQYYDTVDDILGSDEGSLLAHEPLKTEMKSIYGGYPVKMNGETNYVFFKKWNEPPGYDSLDSRPAYQRLPDNLKITGGPQVVHEAAVNALNKTVAYAQDLNKIESSIEKGKDPDYGIFRSGDPDMKGLALIARLNPRATAQVLMSNPQLANSPVLCKMIAAGEDFEKEKEIEGKIQTVVADGAIVVGVGAALLPTGVTQVAGGALTALGIGLSLEGAKLSAQQAYESYQEGQRTSHAYSATTNIDLKYDSEKANSQMIQAAAQAVGNAASSALLLKTLNAGASAERIALNQALLQEASTSAKSGEFALNAFGDPQAEGAIMSRLKSPAELKAIDAAAKRDPRAWSQLVQDFKKICPVSFDFQSPRDSFAADMLSLIEAPALSLIETPAEASDIGCSLNELNRYVDRLRRFAGLDSSTLKPGDLVSVNRSGNQVSNGRILEMNGENVVVQVIRADGSLGTKVVKWWDLGNPEDIAEGATVPANATRAQAPGNLVNYESISGNHYSGYYVAEDNEHIYIKDSPDTQVIGLRKARLLPVADRSQTGAVPTFDGGPGSTKVGDTVTFRRTAGEEWEGKLLSVDPKTGKGVVSFYENGAYNTKSVNLDEVGLPGERPPAAPRPRRPQRVDRPQTPPKAEHQTPPRPPEPKYPPRNQTPQQVQDFDNLQRSFPSSRVSAAEEKAMNKNYSYGRDYGMNALGANGRAQINRTGQQILGLDPNKTYTTTEINSQWKKMLRQFHQDNARSFGAKYGISEEEAADILHNEASMVNNAHDILVSIHGD